MGLCDGLFIGGYTIASLKHASSSVCEGFWNHAAAFFNVCWCLVRALSVMKTGLEGIWCLILPEWRKPLCLGSKYEVLHLNVPCFILVVQFCQGFLQRSSLYVRDSCVSSSLSIHINQKSWSLSAVSVFTNSILSSLCDVETQGCVHSFYGIMTHKASWEPNGHFGLSLM